MEHALVGADESVVELVRDDLAYDQLRSFVESLRKNVD
jgi:hypothetical protein